MNSKKFTMLSAVIAAAMMLCMAFTPVFATDGNVSAEDVTDGKTLSGGEISLDDLEEIIGDGGIEDLLQKYGGTDFDFEKIFGKNASDFITESGMFIHISSSVKRILLNKIGEAQVVDEVKTFTEGQTLDLVGESERVSLKFTENGKYVVEEGATVLLCETLALEGKGTIIELKEGSIIKFDSDAEGYVLDKDVTIALNGTYESYAAMDTETYAVKGYVDLDGTLEIDNVKIEGSGNLLSINAAVAKNNGIEITKLNLNSIASVPLEIKLDADIKSVTVTNKSSEIVFSDIKADVDMGYEPAAGKISGTAKGSISVKSNGITMTCTYDVDSKISGLVFDDDTIALNKETKIEFTENGDFTFEVKGDDVNTKVSTACSIDGTVTGDTFSVTVKANISDIKTDMIEAKGVEAFILMTGKTSDLKDSSEIPKMIDSTSYVTIDSAKIKTEQLNAEVSKVTLSADVIDDVQNATLEIGSLKANGKITSDEKTSIEMSNVKVVTTTDGKKITVTGDSLTYDFKPVLSSDAHVSGKNFKAVKDGETITLVSGTYEFSGVSSANAKMVISKDAAVTANTMEFINGDLTVEDGNKNINGVFIMLPGSEYNYGAGKTIEVDDSSLGHLTVVMDSGVQTLAIDPISAGYTLKVSEEGLAYKVNEDGTGTFTDAEPSGELCAACEPKSFKLVVGDEISTEKEYMEPFILPEPSKTEEGKTFLGWNDGYRTYSAGHIMTMPARDVTFTAVWGDTTYDVDKEGKKYSVIKDIAESLIISEDDITDMIKKIGEGDDVTFDIKTDSFSISFDSKAAAGFDDELSITVKQIKTEDIDDNVAYAVENGALYTIDATCGINEVHEFNENGTAKVTVIYELKDGQKASDLTGYYLNTASSSLEAVDTTVKDIGNERVEVTMTLEHFSDYIVKEKAVAASDDSSSGDNGMSVGVTAGVIVAIIVILAIAGVVLMKRKG